MKNITIVGGGNSAHTLIPLLSRAGNNISLLTRQPERWGDEIIMEYVLSNGEVKDSIKGKIKKISDNAYDVIPDADIIILSLPVSSYRIVLDRIGAVINKEKKVFIGTIYGQGGFNWMVDEIKTKYNLRSVVTFAIGLIPWITRTSDYGKVGINYGPKKVNVAAVSPSHEFENLNKLLLRDICYSYFNTGEFKQADNFLSLTLSVDNQIIHQTRLYGLHLGSNGSWSSFNDIPYFYKDYDELSAKLLEDLDFEYSQIRREIIKRYPNKKFTYMLNYLELERLTYGSSNENIKESFTTSKTLGQIPTPVIKIGHDKWIINSDHRFFYDDIYYGICIAKWIAQKLYIETPVINKILNWAQEILDDTIIEKNKLVDRQEKIFTCGLPSVYGYSSIDELVD